MNNLFPAHRDIHETYDLKGSTVGRLLPDSKLEDNPGAVMKDLNWLNRSRTLEVCTSDIIEFSDLTAPSRSLARINVLC